MTPFKEHRLIFQQVNPLKDTVNYMGNTISDPRAILRLQREQQNLQQSQQRAAQQYQADVAKFRDDQQPLRQQASDAQKAFDNAKRTGDSSANIQSYGDANLRAQAQLNSFLGKPPTEQTFINPYTGGQNLYQFTVNKSAKEAKQNTVFTDRMKDVGRFQASREARQEGLTIQGDQRVLKDASGNTFNAPVISAPKIAQNARDLQGILNKPGAPVRATLTNVNALNEQIDQVSRAALERAKTPAYIQRQLQNFGFSTDTDPFAAYSTGHGTVSFRKMSPKEIMRRFFGDQKDDYTPEQYANIQSVYEQMALYDKIKKGEYIDPNDLNQINQLNEQAVQAAAIEQNTAAANQGTVPGTAAGVPATAPDGTPLPSTDGSPTVAGDEGATTVPTVGGQYGSNTPIIDPLTGQPMNPSKYDDLFQSGPTATIPGVNSEAASQYGAVYDPVINQYQQSRAGYEKARASELNSLSAPDITTLWDAKAQAKEDYQSQLDILDMQTELNRKRTDEGKLAALRDNELSQNYSAAQMALAANNQRRINQQQEVLNRRKLNKLNNGGHDFSGLDWISAQIQQGTEALNSILEKSAYLDQTYANKAIDIINNHQNDMQEIDNNSLIAYDKAYSSYLERIGQAQDDYEDDEDEFVKTVREINRYYSKELTDIDMSIGNAYRDRNLAIINRTNALEKEAKDAEKEVYDQAMKYIDRYGTGNKAQLNRYETQLGLTPGSLSDQKTLEELRLDLSYLRFYKTKSNSSIAVAPSAMISEIEELRTNIVGANPTFTPEEVDKSVGNYIQYTYGRTTKGQDTVNEYYDYMMRNPITDLSVYEAPFLPKAGPVMEGQPYDVTSLPADRARPSYFLIPERASPFDIEITNMGGGVPGIFTEEQRAALLEE